MKKRTKIVLLSILGTVLIGPFLVPVNTSGTLSNRAAAKEVWGEKSNFLELASHEVHYVTAGDPQSDRLIIALHGFGASSLTWKSNLTDLSKLGQVIAYDRAAFGFTARPTDFEGLNPYSTKAQYLVITELVERFGKDKEIVLLGHSAGGTIAAGYVAQHPGKVNLLILEDPAIYSSGGTPTWLNWIYSIPQLDHIGPLAVSSIATAGLDILNQSYHDPNKITQTTIDYYTQPLKVIGWEQAFWEFNKAERDTSVAKNLQKITIPTLVITGDDDQIVPTEQAIRLAAELPISRLEVIRQAGHLPNEEKPVEFNAAIDRFISQKG